jgi:signal transduction histidine kinase
LPPPEVGRAGIRLIERIAPAATAGDPKLIESLIANLLDNAIRHNRPDGYIRITIEAGPSAGVTVSNSGPVVPEDQLQRLLQPFQRLSPSRNDLRDGYGLGLAIGNAVAHAHRATLAVATRAEGGLDVTVRFAAAPHPDHPRARSATPTSGPSRPKDS